MLCGLTKGVFKGEAKEAIKVESKSSVSSMSQSSRVRFIDLSSFPFILEVLYNSVFANPFGRSSRSQFRNHSVSSKVSILVYVERQSNARLKYFVNLVAQSKTSVYNLEPSSSSVTARHIYSIIVINPATTRKAKLLLAVRPDAELLSVVSVSWLKPLLVSVLLGELVELEFLTMVLWLAPAAAVTADIEPD